jgi:anti-sigma regulatory factor (Ser/Thr protein kinase)
VNALSLPEIRVPGGPKAPGLMRARLDGELAGELRQDRLAEVMLLTTEVVSNSVRHGRVGTDGWVSSAVHVGGDHVRIEVRDSGIPRGIPHQRTPNYEDGGGFGLFLLDQVADRWGVEQDSGLCVWFELTLP